MRRLAFAAPGPLTTPTGGFVYDRRIVTGLESLGWRVETIDLGEGFPHPTASARAEAGARLAALPRDIPIVIDGLALGALPEVANELRDSHRLVGLVHHPLALESGLSAADAAALRASETRAIASVRSAIATSAFTARQLVSDYGAPAERVRVVRPGVDRAPQARGGAGDPVALLAVGAVTFRKGYDLLLAAVATLRDLSWRLTIVGDLTRDRAAAARLLADIARFDLCDRIAVEGAVSAERLAQIYRAADVFALASRFEGYGMAYVEAIAHGLPVIGTRAGAIPEAVGGAGLLTPPEDSVAFASALRRVIADAGERRRLSEAARAAAATLPTWEQQAELFSRAIENSA